MSADMRGGFQMEQSPHSSGGSEIFPKRPTGVWTPTFGSQPISDYFWF